MKIVPGILAASLLGTLFSSGAGLEGREFTAKDGTIVKYRWSAPAKIEPGKSIHSIFDQHR